MWKHPVRDRVDILTMITDNKNCNQNKKKDNAALTLE